MAQQDSNNTPASSTLKDYFKLTQRANEMRNELRLFTQLISSEQARFKNRNNGNDTKSLFELPLDDETIRLEVMVGMQMGNTLIFPKSRLDLIDKVQQLLEQETIPFIKTTFWDADLECIQFILS